MKRQSLPYAAQCMRAIRWVVLGATLAGAAATFSPAAVQALSVSSDYIVVLRDGVNLSKKVASEEKRGNDVADTFSAGSDGFVASLDSSDVARLRKDNDIRIIERDAPVSLVSDNEPDRISALSTPTGAVGEAIPGRYIVQYKTRAALLSSVSTLGISVLANYTNVFPGYVAELSAATVNQLRVTPGVVLVEQDTVVTINTDQAIGAGDSWGLDRVDQRSLPMNGTYSYTSTGTGVSAYIIDTGIRATHTQLAGRVGSGFTAVNDGNSSSDCHGHGTHVSGTVGGTKYGIAKNVNFFPVRVLDCSGSGSISGVIAGVDWVIAHHIAGVPAVANMSLGGGYSPSLNAAVARGVVDGVVFAIAAGNEASNACDVSPASEPTAITVGATGSTDARAYFSNYGSCVDIFAPGVGITSSTATSDTSTASWSGTSMAAPHVAGVVAQYLQSHPTDTPAQVARALDAAATQNIVANPGTGSPNKLLYNASFDPAPITVPSAPNSVRSVVGSSQVTLSWGTPSTDGGASISNYVVEYSSASGLWTTFSHPVSTALSLVVTGLTNGTTYSFRVSATNSVGTSVPSAIVTAAPRDPALPSAPTGVVATAADASAVVRWAAPSATTISSITIDSSTPYIDIPLASGPLDVIGHSDHSCAAHVASAIDPWLDVIEVSSGRVILSNDDGAHDYSTDCYASRITTTISGSGYALRVKGCCGHPYGVVRLEQRSTVIDVTGYTVTSSPGARTCTTTTLSCTVTGLTNGTPYTFTVIATNAVGNSVSSAASTAVTPFAYVPGDVVAASWGLDRIDQRALPLNGRITRAGAGAGVTAYVIDTGIYAEHSEFGTRVKSGFGAVNDGRGTQDCHGHGTHVSGTVGGTTYGVAPLVSLVPVRVLDCYGSGSLSGVIAGIDFMIQDHLAGVPAVANMSLGGAGVSASLNDAVERAIADGITVVVAAGNSYADACGFSPASATGAVTVGATTSSDSMAYYSNYGSCVDIFAPGSSITSAAISSVTATATMSGTSMASPHVAGVVAVLLGTQSSLTPAAVTTVLKTTATPDVVTSLGAGSPNLLLFSRLVAPASATPVTPPTTVPTTDTPVTPPTTVPATATPVTPPTTVPTTVPTVDSRSSIDSAPQITAITSVGRSVTVTVNAPAGALVTIVRNGKVVAKGKASVFTLKNVARGNHSFMAKVKIGKRILKSQVVSFSVSKKR